MLSDIEIAQKAKCLPIKEIAKSLSIEEDDLDFTENIRQSFRFRLSINIPTDPTESLYL